MKRIRDLLGGEHPMDMVNRALRDYARNQRAAAVGAMHVTCSDECERECVDSFQQWFAQDLLPELKFWSKSPFRTANLGGRYEWGTIPIAEEHFATPQTKDSFKLLVVKINAHVCVVGSGARVQYGKMDRYGSESVCCGGIHALLGGAQQPAIDSLREIFASEGKDRLAMLLDRQQIDPEVRVLLAAVVSARLQARRAVLDLQNYLPTTPTRYLVLPCVTLNRPQRDTELVVGMYHADCLGPAVDVSYFGLDDDPSRYRLSTSHNLLRVADDELHDEILEERKARDHRQLVAARWEKRQHEFAVPREHVETAALAALPGGVITTDVATEALKTLLAVLVEIALVPTAVMLFIHGVSGIHNIYRAYRLADGRGSHHDAHMIVGEIREMVDHLPAHQAAELVKRLSAHYGISLPLHTEVIEASAD